MAASDPGKLRGPGVMRRLRRMSLRMRLILAFSVLIISSASATIVIGTTVFGRKVGELTRSKLELDLKVAEQILLTRLHRLWVLAPAMSRMVEGGAIDPHFCTYLLEDAPFDFALVSQPGQMSLTRFQASRAVASGEPAAPAGTDERSCRIERLPAEMRVDFEASGLFALAQQAETDQNAVSGLVVLSRREIARLGYADAPEQGLFMMAASPLQGGGALVEGAILNGRADLVSSTLELLALQANVQYKASIFLGDVRIATTLGSQAFGTQVDEAVSRRVLQEGGVYVGSAEVLGRTLNAAYKPLRDFRGRIVGMLGIATDEDVYGYVRGHTITLFSGLIGAGMIFGLVMSFLFSSALIKPVGELADAMNRVAQGDLNYKVRIESPQELGRLARAFNQMVREVKERDMRLREMTEERLGQVEKQVSVGRLAAGVAHEINNPLTAVLSLSSLILKKLPADDPRREDLEVVVTETTRCREIVRSLLDFARERPTAKQMVDVNQVLKETLALTHNYESLARANTVLQLHAAPLYVMADAKQLQQVLANVVINAAEAMKPGGTITLTTDEDSSGGFVVIQVRDTGKGIPHRDLQRVFEPFYTTKEPGKGTGLGLSVSLGIVRKHSGAIEIESEEGKGTLVSITLPRHQPPGEGAAG